MPAKLSWTDGSAAVAFVLNCILELYFMLFCFICHHVSACWQDPLLLPLWYSPFFLECECYIFLNTFLYEVLHCEASSFHYSIHLRLSRDRWSISKIDPSPKQPGPIEEVQCSEDYEEKIFHAGFICKSASNLYNLRSNCSGKRLWLYLKENTSSKHCYSSLFVVVFELIGLFFSYNISLFSDTHHGWIICIHCNFTVIIV